MKIHACLMTQNEQKDLVENVTLLLRYVDSVTIVDGGSNDQTIPYMRNWSQKNSKIRFFIHPWQDNFPAQRNNYLARVSEVATDGDWLLCLDPDEFVHEDSLKVLRTCISEAETKGCNMVGFQCFSQSYKGEVCVWENKDQYWKRFLIKWSPSLKYGAVGGQVHEFLGGLDQRIWDPSNNINSLTPLFYDHRKQENIIWQRGLRNMWIGGGGPNGQHDHINDWKKLRDISSRLGHNDWHSFYKYLLKGNIDQELKDWMVEHMNDSWGDGSSEFREAYKTYFRLLHPEEEKDEYRGIHIQ